MSPTSWLKYRILSKLKPSHERDQSVDSYFVNIKYSGTLQKYKKIINPKSRLNLPVTSGSKLKPWRACSCMFLKLLEARSQAYLVSACIQTELALCWQYCNLTLNLLQGGNTWTFWLQRWIPLQPLPPGYVKALLRTPNSAFQITMWNPDIQQVSWHYFGGYSWKY